MRGCYSIREGFCPWRHCPETFIVDSPHRPSLTLFVQTAMKSNATRPELNAQYSGNSGLRSTTAICLTCDLYTTLFAKSAAERKEEEKKKKKLEGHSVKRMYLRQRPKSENWASLTPRSSATVHRTETSIQPVKLPGPWTTTWSKQYLSAVHPVTCSLL